MWERQVGSDSVGQSAARGRVARAGICRRHATLVVQQNSRRRRLPGRTARGGCPESNRDDFFDLHYSSRVVCAWPGEGRGKLSGSENSMWAGDTGCAVRGRLPRGEGPGRAWGAPWAGSPVSRAHLLALGSRALQVQEERLAHALDALSTACRHPELPPVARSCAQGMGGMTIRPCRRCLVLPRCTVPTHHVVLCTKVRSRRPPTGRCSAVLPLS